jgi:ketosteroid isomerase-like protein
MKKLFLAAIVSTIGIFTGCNSGGGDPKVVLAQFFEALGKKDLAAARKLATADSKSMLDMMEMGMKSDTKEFEKYGKASMEFGDAKIDGDKATVAVKEKESGETLNYILKKENGSWKVAFDKASMMTMGMDKMSEKGINVTDSLENVMDKLKDINMDSLQRGLKEGAKAMDSAAKMLEKLKN